MVQALQGGVDEIKHKKAKKKTKKRFLMPCAKPSFIFTKIFWENRKFINWHSLYLVSYAGTLIC